MVIKKFAIAITQILFQSTQQVLKTLLLVSQNWHRQILYFVH